MGEERMICRAGACSFWIDWQGHMTNCGMYNSAFASLDDRPFREAWQELKEKTEQISYASPCGGCPNRHLCHSCIAMAVNETGHREGKPEYVCRMNEALSILYPRFASLHYPELTGTPAGAESRQDICEL